MVTDNIGLNVFIVLNMYITCSANIHRFFTSSKCPRNIQVYIDIWYKSTISQYA